MIITKRLREFRVWRKMTEAKPAEIEILRDTRVAALMNGGTRHGELSGMGRARKSWKTPYGS